MAAVAAAVPARAWKGVRRRARGQGSVLDRGLSAVVGGAAVVAVLGTWFMFSGTADAHRQQAQIEALAKAVTSLYATQNGYTGLTETVMANSGMLPPEWVSDPGTAQAGIVSVYKSRIRLVPFAYGRTVKDGNFVMIIEKVPSKACSAVLSSMMDADLVNVSQNFQFSLFGTTFTATNTTALPLTAQNVTVACHNGTIMDMALRFR